MPRETTNRRAVLDAIDSVDAISELTAREGGHFVHELDLEVCVYGRNYNGKRVGPYIRLLSYEPGETIVNQGEWGGNTFFVLVRGGAEVFVRTDQSETLVRRIGSGAQFGELSVLAGVPRAATVRAAAATEAQVLEITRPALRLLRKLPKFSSRLDAEYRRNGRSATLTALQTAAGLQSDAINQLEAISQFRIFSKGHTLFEEGAPINHVFLINAGWALLTGASRAVESYAGALTSFGLEFFDGARAWSRTCTLQARSEVLEIPITKLDGVPALREALTVGLSPKSPADDGLPAGVVASQKRLIETGLADATNLLVMDMELCVRCGNCSLACHKVHGETRLVRRGLHVARLKSVREVNGSLQSLLAPAVCLHCQDPECLTGCPTGAIQRLPGGEVDINPTTCIGCGDCAAQCPYNAISMVSRRAAGRPLKISLGQELFSLDSEGLPPPVEQTEDLLAVKCNLCAKTSLNPDPNSRQAYSCEENCPTGALLRVTPNEYFPEIRLLEGRRVVRPGMGARLRRTIRDHSLRTAHLIGALATIIISVLTAIAVYRDGLERVLVGSWVNLRWITGIGGLVLVLIVMAYPMRRKVYRKRAGPLRYWLLVHLYAGLIAAVVLLLHAGTRSGGTLTTVLTISFDLVILTGLYGMLCYLVIPRMLTRIEEQPLLIEDLEARRGELRASSGSAINGASGSVRSILDSKLLPRVGSWNYRLKQLFTSQNLEYFYGHEVRSLNGEIKTLSPEEGETLAMITRELITLRRVEGLVTLHRLLKSWIVPHVLTTALMLALMVIHIVQVVYFAAR